MARGLMPQGGAPPAAAAPPPLPNGAPGPGGGPQQQAPGAQGRPTDADKDTYRHFLANAVDMVSEDEIADGLVEQLRSEAPVEGVAQTIAMVVNHIGQDGRGRGVPVHGAMAVAAAATLAGDIGITWAEAAGREPLNADQIQAVFLRSMELLRDMQGDGQGPPAGEDTGPPGPAGPQPGNGLMPGMAQDMRGPRP